MAQIKVDIPSDLEIRIQQLVDEGEFTSYEEAVRELLSSGLTAYRTGDTNSQDEFGTDFDDDYGSRDPAGHDDEYVF